MRPPYIGLLNHLGGRGGARATRTNPVVLGRRFCARCGRWRPVSDFPRCAKSLDGLFAYCYPCKRAYEREARASWPESKRALRREYNRIYSDAQRREAGVPSREAYRKSTVVDHVERVLLDREPLVAELRQRRGELGLLADKAQVPERTITRLLNGESHHVRLDVADKLAVAMGVPLALLYHDERDGVGQ